MNNEKKINEKNMKRNLILLIGFCVMAINISQAQNNVQGGNNSVTATNKYI